MVVDQEVPVHDAVTHIFSRVSGTELSFNPGILLRHSFDRSLLLKNQKEMPNDPYLDASVAWRIKAKRIDFQESGYHETVQSILENGLATDVRGMISSGKEANVYLAEYNGSPIAVKVYRLYQTSHKGGRPIKLDSAGWMAAHEYDMLLQAWRGGVAVPTPAKRVENMLSMRYLCDENGPAPRLQDTRPDDPEGMLGLVLKGVESLGRAGVVHTDLSPYNVLVMDDRPWFIDLSEALRGDRTGDTSWTRLTEAEAALRHGLAALDQYFRRFGLTVEEDEMVQRMVRSWDRFGVMS